jgi:hypothetical protein
MTNPPIKPHPRRFNSTTTIPYRLARSSDCNRNGAQGALETAMQCRLRLRNAATLIVRSDGRV